MRYLDKELNPHIPRYRCTLYSEGIWSFRTILSIDYVVKNKTEFKKKSEDNQLLRDDTLMVGILFGF